jgi:hypothetical protein
LCVALHDCARAGELLAVLEVCLSFVPCWRLRT